MSNHDKPVWERQQDERIEELPQTEQGLIIVPESQAYQRLKLFHMAQATAEAQRLERVRQRLAAYADAQKDRIQSVEPGKPLVPPIPMPRRLSHSRSLVNTLVAIVLVGILVSGFVLLMHGRTMSTSASNLLPGNGPVIHSNNWHVVASPNIAGMGNNLANLSVATGTDAWAVGNAYNGKNPHTPNTVQSTSNSMPLVEHWDGKHWAIVPTPAGQGFPVLEAVLDIAPGDAWLAGSSLSVVSGKSVATPLFEHWDGQQWNIVPGPRSASGSSFLSALAGVSSNDVWAVGFFPDRTNQDIIHPLIEHWNGKQWNIVPSHVAANANLLSISAISANDVWAVGWIQASQQSPIPEITPSRTLVEHWDGQQWKVVTSPNPGSVSNILHSITAVSSKDVWAIGSITDGNLYPPKPGRGQGSSVVSKTLVEHWNGKQWQIVASPNPSTTEMDFDHITALGPNDIWITGFLVNNSAGALLDSTAIIEHWDGHKWQMTTGFKQANDQSFSGIARDPSLPGKLWIVGSYNTNPQSTLSNQTLIETNF